MSGLTGDVTLIDSVGKWACPAAGARAGAEAAHQVLVGEAEHGSQVTADVRDRQQRQRNAEHRVDDRRNSTFGRLGRDVPVACRTHVIELDCANIIIIIIIIIYLFQAMRPIVTIKY